MGEVIETITINLPPEIKEASGKFYADKMDILRELAAGGYDRDAVVVRISVEGDTIIADDNGRFMDMEEMKRYLSPDGQTFDCTTKFHREPIGEQGLGKFAIFLNFPSFEVWSMRQGFCIKARYSRDPAEKNAGDGPITLQWESSDQYASEGVRVILKGLTEEIDLWDAERRILEAVPIKADNFLVYLNKKKVRIRFIPGHHLPFIEKTRYGIVTGEFAINPWTRSGREENGIECIVKGKPVCREFFGMREWTYDIVRISGKLEADFLTVNKDGDDFINDTEEYKAFWKVAERLNRRSQMVLAELADRKENRRIRRALKEILEKVRASLAANSDVFPNGRPVGIGGEDKRMDSFKYLPVVEEAGKAEGLKRRRGRRRTRTRIKRFTPTAVMIKRISGWPGVSCCIDHFGEDGKECFSDGNAVYFNRDHPLFRKEIKNKYAYALYIARLLTQEIALLKGLQDPRQAFELQSKILKDALCRKEEWEWT